MTYLEMLEEIDLLRSQGHTIGITGHVGHWRCEYDSSVGNGVTLVDAFLDAKRLALDTRERV